MFLSPHHAQKLVEDMYHLASYNLIFTDKEGIIIASMDKSRIGDFHEGALEALHTQKTVIIRRNNQYKGAKEGIIYPIFLNKKVIGVIGITGKEEEVGKVGELVKRVAEMLVKEIHMERQAELEYIARQSFVQEWLLHRQDDEHVFASRGYLLGIDVTLPRMVGIFEFQKKEGSPVGEEENEELTMRKIQNQMLKGINYLLPNPEYDVAAPVGSSRFVILYTLPKEITREQAKEYIFAAVCDLKSWLEEHFTYRIAVGIGSLYQGVDGVKSSYIEGEKAAYFSKGKEMSSVIFYEDLRLERLIYDLPAASRWDYISGILKLDKLPDPEQVIETLHCLFQCNHSINEVAQRLQIHKNTVQYRLNKIREMTGFDPRNFEDAAVLYLAVFLYLLEQRS
ncbi:MAG: CdaR family transcriptional regulator [Ectobacillus sp.]